jgi:peroxiredoxin
VVAIVADAPERVRAFKEREAIPFDILSDPAGAVFEAFGVARSRKVRGRPYAYPTTAVFDRDGVARFVEVRRVLFMLRASPAKLAAALDAIP